MVVTGVPGAGKTTIATQVASGLALPLFSLDAVKEALYDELEALDPSRSALRGSAEAVLAVLLRDAVGGAVVDIWLDPSRGDRDRLRNLLPPGRALREVYCDVPADVAVRRYRGRSRHAAHLPPDEDLLRRIAVSVELMAVGAVRAPTGLGPLRRVDTSREVLIADLIGWLAFPA